MNRAWLVVMLVAIAAPLGPPPAIASDAQRGRATVSVSGDLLIHDSVLARALALGGGDSYDFEPMLAGLRPWIDSPDLAICHVETPITDLAPPSGYPRFNSPPALVEAIAATGWDACTTASNHSLDQGTDGIAATARALDRAGVEHTGIYTSPGARRRPLILDARGVRVALVSYTVGINYRRDPPAPHKVNVVVDPAAIIADAARARRAGADAVIVNLHWTPTGWVWTPAITVPSQPEYVPEYVPDLGPAQVELVTTLLRADEITTVVGQGAHVVQPIRKIGRKYAVFGEGDLISGNSPLSALSPASQDGLIALLTLRSNDAEVSVERVRYVPTFVLRPSHLVVPADPAVLEDSYRRTVSVAGRGAGIEPVQVSPRRSP